MPDHERPLNKRGRQAAQKMGKFMRSAALLPDYVLASSAKRVQETLSLWSNSSGYAGQVGSYRALYLAEPAVYIEHLRELSDPTQPCVMCVGHNPGLEMLVSLMTGVGATMPTAALAHIEFAIDNWQALDLETRGRLVNLHKVKALED
jgi:phosphohistidine phosphatase